MPTGRQTHLARDLSELRARIASAISEPNSKHRRILTAELLRVVCGLAEFDAIPREVPQTVGLTQRISRRLMKTKHSLAGALYRMVRYGATEDMLRRPGGLARSEWLLVQSLAAELKRPLSDVYRDITNPPTWMVDIDESHQELRVWIRELALQDMLLAGLETFLVPAGSGKPSTEVYGIAFGSYRLAPRGTGVETSLDVNVERVCIQHRARLYPSEVITDARSERMQLAMAEELFPYWHLVGDFHTHTYRDLAELYQRSGWKYSEWDERVNIEWCAKLREEGHKPRVALILTLTRAGRTGNSAVEQWNGMPHVLRATVGRCHCFIAAYRIRADGRYSTDAITLKCPHLVGHLPEPAAGGSSTLKRFRLAAQRWHDPRFEAF